MPDARHPQLPRAVHGGPGGAPFEGPDFSVNVNPFGPNPELLAAARSADAATYPDPAMREERAALAAWHDVNAAGVVPAQGASELLHRLARAYLTSGDVAVSVLAPFGEFARAVALERAQLLTTTPERAEETVRTRRPALVYLCRPHNPTGLSVPSGDVTRLADACADVGALLILDEAYAHLHLQPEPIAPHPSVVRVHSPGKLHGLVGVRPAYALAAPEIAGHLTNLAPAWSVSAPTLAVLRALPHAQAFVQGTLPRWHQAASALKRELHAFGTVHDQNLPFFTLQVGRAREITEQLLTRGVRVRDCTSYGLPDCVRVSARQDADNARLVQALREVLGG